MPPLQEPLLLVICTGNVCRSPMAEGLFIHHLVKRGLRAQVISRGLAAPVGRPPHEYALEVAKRHGVSIDANKRAEALTSVEVAMAAAIFVMDSDHRRQVQSRYPNASGKTFLLGHWQGQEITDPINQPIPAFELVWQQCDTGVQSWIDRLCEAGLIRARDLA